ncbi:MAG: hypothetical protein J6R71_08760, partial [Bacteroidales bacterium]|nr:hypothetical protein [Bacteroidales bacterium]
KSLEIKSNIGGNLRLRTHSDIDLQTAEGTQKLQAAKGENSNPLFVQQEIARPMISPKAPMKGVELKPYQLYDLETKAGEIYRFVKP